MRGRRPSARYRVAPAGGPSSILRRLDAEASSAYQPLLRDKLSRGKREESWQKEAEQASMGTGEYTADPNANPRCSMEMSLPLLQHRDPGFLPVPGLTSLHLDSDVLVEVRRFPAGNNTRVCTPYGFHSSR